MDAVDDTKAFLEDITGGKMTETQLKKIKQNTGPSFPIRLKMKGGAYVDTIAVNPFH